MKVLVAGSTGYPGRYIGVLQLFHWHAADHLDFFATAGRYEDVAPCFGRHTLDEYFQELSRPPAER